MTSTTRSLLAALLISTITACSEDAEPPSQGPATTDTEIGERAPADAAAEPASAGTVGVDRWYDAERPKRGAKIYAVNCAGCHGANGQGSFAWRKRDASGKFPPPPVNGTGHTWHHPFRALGAQIKRGTPGGQGNMPGFGETLSDEEILDVIAWFQDKWSDEIYANCIDIERRSRGSRR